MSDELKKVIQTPFVPTIGGYIPETENTDLIAVNARKDQEAMRLKDEEFGRQIESSRVLREIREAREAAEKKTADEEKQRDREQKKSDRARTLFLGSLPGLDSLLSGASCVVHKWPEGLPAEYPAETHLLIAKLEQLLAVIKSRLHP